MKFSFISKILLPISLGCFILNPLIISAQEEVPVEDTPQEIIESPEEDTVEPAKNTQEEKVDEIPDNSEDVELVVDTNTEKINIEEKTDIEPKTETGQDVAPEIIEIPQTEVAVDGPEQNHTIDTFDDVDSISSDLSGGDIVVSFDDTKETISESQQEVADDQDDFSEVEDSELVVSETISSDFTNLTDVVASLDNVENDSKEKPEISQESLIDKKESREQKFLEDAVPTQNFGSEIVSFPWTDDNTNENLIIRTNKKDYYGLIEDVVYISVTNAGDTPELVNLQFYFPQDNGRLTSLEQWSSPKLQKASYKNNSNICNSGWSKTSERSSLFKKIFGSSFQNMFSVNRYVFAQSEEPVTEEGVSGESSKNPDESISDLEESIPINREMDTREDVTHTDALEEVPSKNIENTSSSQLDYFCSDTNEYKQCTDLEEEDTFCVTNKNKNTKKQNSKESWDKVVLTKKTHQLPNSLSEIVSGKKIKRKKVPETLSLSGSTQLSQENPKSQIITPGQTMYYRATLTFDPGTDGQFYIEAIGDANGYGLLDPWWTSSWNYKQSVTIDNSGSSQSFNEYQFFVDLDSSYTEFWSQVKSDGGDIRFLDTTETTELEYAIIHFDYTNQELQAWVKVDSIPASSTTDVYLYYGNSAATTTSDVESTFSYIIREPRFYAISNEQGSNDAVGITFFDNNDYVLGSDSDTDWDIGALENPKTTITSNFSVGDVAESTGPIAIDQSAGDAGEMWAPAAWQSTEFVTTFPRGGTGFYILNPQLSTANIQVFKDGVSVDTFTLNAGIQTSKTYTHTNDAHWRIQSDIPILLFQESGGTDHVNVPPPSYELFGTVRTTHVACSQDGTTITAYFSDGTTEATACDKDSVWQIATAGGTQGSGPSVRFVADKPIHAVSQADGDGNEEQAAYGIQDLDTEYLVPNNYDYIACTAPYENTTINILNMLGVQVTTSGNLGTNGIEFPHHWIDSTTRIGGHRITANNPIYCYTEDSASGDERNLVNRVLNRKGGLSNQSFVLGDQETNQATIPEIIYPFNYEKVGTQTPNFQFRSTDIDGDDLVYEVRWDTDNTFGSPTVRSSATHTGFANLDTGADTSPFNENETIEFAMQPGDALINGETYWYQVRAQDIAGSGIFSAWSERRSITIDTGITNVTWHQTTDEQFTEGEFLVVLLLLEEIV